MGDQIREVAPLEATEEQSTTEGQTKQLREGGKLLEESKQRSIDVVTGTQSLLTVVILVLACMVAFSSRLFAVIRFESIIHEFDPWYCEHAPLINYSLLVLQSQLKLLDVINVCVLFTEHYELL